MKKGWIIGAVVVVVFFMFAAIGSDDSSDNQNEISVNKSERTESKGKQKAQDTDNRKQTEETDTENEDGTPIIKTAADAREYMDKCLGNFLEYSDMIRYEEKYVGTDYALDVSVAQVMDDGTLRVYDDPNGYGTYLGNEYMIRDKRVLDNTKIIENDIITFYGRYMGLTDITRAFGEVTDSLPVIDMYLCDIGGVSVKANAETADYSLYEDLVCDYSSEEAFYTLYDMDNDGVKELIVTNDAGMTCDVYTLSFGGVMGLGSFEVSTDLYASPNGDGLYSVYCWKKEYSVEKITVNNDQLNITSVTEGDFTESDLLKQVETTDLSLLK